MIGAIIQSRQALRSRAVSSIGVELAGGLAAQYMTGQTRYNGRRKLETKTAVKSPVLAFPAFTLTSTGCVAAPNAFTISAAIEYSGAVYPVTFAGGATTQVISSAVANWFYSDPIAGLQLPAGVKVYCRVEVIAASSTDNIPSGTLSYPGTWVGDEQMILGGTLSQVSATGIMTAAASGGGTLAGFANEHPYSPAMLLGLQTQADAKHIIVMGDSITQGYEGSEATPDAGANYGWGARGAYLAGVPCGKFARGSWMLRYATPAISPQLYELMGSATTVYVALGSNDINTGRTLAQCQADAIAIWAGIKAKGARVIHSKVLARTNASNVCSPAFDPAGTNIRGLFNTWLDTQVGTLIDGTINMSPVLENGTTGTWANFAAHTPDGTHPYSTASDLIAVAFAPLI